MNKQESQVDHRRYGPSDIERVELIVGMEVHVELATRSKMFSRVPNPACAEYEHASPNTLIDPVVLALPGSLPVMNAAAVEMSMRVGLALGCSISSVSKWDRKGYFYPDLPKAYQISQYELPLCFDGRFEVPSLDERGRFDLEGTMTTISIVRAHLEEDAGKLLHEMPDGQADEIGDFDGSIVDLNRAGTPLLEIVTQPDFHSVDECVAFAKLLRLTCVHLGITRGIMQKGHMRFEPNINCKLVLGDGRTVITPIVEVKNLNSFRALAGAVSFELSEQPKRWLSDGQVMDIGNKTTRGWDAHREVTLVQRNKEDAHDYRYFPDPDLLPVHSDAQQIAALKAALPELPLARLKRYVIDEEMSIADASVLIEDRAISDCFDAIVDALVMGSMDEDGMDRVVASGLAANLVIQVGLKAADERGVALDKLGIEPSMCAQMIELREKGTIDADGVRKLFGLVAQLVEKGTSEIDVEELAKTHGLVLNRDEGQLRAWCEQVIAEQAAVAEQVRSGKVQAVGRLIGAVRQISSGAADAKAVRAMLLELLGQADQDKS